MIISVKFDTISSLQYSQVIEYYNQNKPNNWNPLEKLDRAEGGFQIKLDKVPYNTDVNYTIKQVRWNNKYLTSGLYIYFSDTETKLLYDSLCHVFGSENVVLHIKKD
jgi:hypothetical protein